MREASKSLRRRWCEDFATPQIFPWRDLFRGRILDVGAGDDPLPFDDVVSFDTPDGDANKLSTYFEPESFDVVHASQSLEHMINPVDALSDWFKCLKQYGHLVVTVPDFDIYEKRRHPSKFNADHKAVFSMWRHGFPGVSPFYHVPTMLKEFLGKIALDPALLCRLVATNFDWQAPEDKDQTFVEEAHVECWIEFVLRKI